MHKTIIEHLLENVILVTISSSHYRLRYTGYPLTDQLDSEQQELDDGVEKTPEPLDLSKLDAENESTYYPVEIESEQVMTKAEDVHSSPDRTSTPPPPLENELEDAEAQVDDVASSTSEEKKVDQGTSVD